jgi:hypothetical protein
VGLRAFLKKRRQRKARRRYEREKEQRERWRKAGGPQGAADAASMWMSDDGD